MVGLGDIPSFLEKSLKHFVIADFRSVVHRVVASPVFCLNKIRIFVEHIADIEKIVSLYGFNKIFLDLGAFILTSEEFADLQSSLVGLVITFCRYCLRFCGCIFFSIF